MNKDRLEFVINSTTISEVKGKKILEVGSRNVNGSVREYIESLNPVSYTGVDIVNGPGVDEICDIQDLIKKFGIHFFDMVICTETLEHVDNWRGAICNMYAVLKNNGILLITVPTIGMNYHGHPDDYWRFTRFDFMKIFIYDKNERIGNGIGVKVVKYEPLGKLYHIKVHSILRGKRILNHNYFDYHILKYYRLFQLKFRSVMVRILPRFVKEGLNKLNIK